MPLGSINIDSKGSDLGKVGQHCVLDVSNCLVISKGVSINTFLSQRYAKDKFLVTSHYGKYIIIRWANLVSKTSFHKLTLLKKKLGAKAKVLPQVIPITIWSNLVIWGQGVISCKSYSWGSCLQAESASILKNDNEVKMKDSKKAHKRGKTTSMSKVQSPVSVVEPEV